MTIKEAHAASQNGSRDIRRTVNKDLGIVAAILVALVVVVGVVLAMRTSSSVASQLSEWKLSVAHASMTPGRYTFKIHNAGAVEHEFIAFKLASPHAAIPLDKNGDVNEDAMQNVTDGPDIAPGGTQTRVVHLTSPGTYIFMCNLEGHYARGMHEIVTVTK
jgi:uncharacterized cupredoxin-like copper-binding protein